MQSIEYRYKNDHIVHTLVNSLVSAIHNLQLTPSEIRECAMLAAILYEQRSSPRSIVVQNGHIAQQTLYVSEALPKLPSFNDLFTSIEKEAWKGRDAFAYQQFEDGARALYNQITKPRNAKNECEKYS